MTSKAETVDIVGIVHPLGPGGAKSGNESLWTLLFSFQPWRAPDGRIDERKLLIRQSGLSNRDLRAMMNVIKAYDVLRVRVRLSEAQAELVGLVGKEDTDRELIARVRELQKPVTIAHCLGTFTLNRALNWYEAECQWNSKPIHLYLHLGQCADAEPGFQVAEHLWQAQPQWDQRIRDFAASKLLSLKNDAWLSEGESALSALEFRDRMKLESISVHPDGLFEFSHHDGDMFWGHMVEVRGTLSKGPTDAQIAG